MAMDRPLTELHLRSLELAPKMAALSRMIPVGHRSRALRLVQVGAQLSAFLGLADDEARQRPRTLLLEAACSACSEAATSLRECRPVVDVSLVDELRAGVLRIAFGISSLVTRKTRVAAPRLSLAYSASSWDHAQGGREHPRVGPYAPTSGSEYQRFGRLQRAP